ncbi:MAG: hypothetical protein ACXW6T_04370 [Candidatus Binatia bacterium]
MRSSETLSETADKNRGQSRIPTIATLGIMTADRPALLERAVASYIQNNQQRNDVEYVVYDDSKDSAASAASFAVAQKLARQFGVPIRFAGTQERECYARQLADSGVIAPELLQYALLNPRGYTLGQNRNTLLLDTVGSMICCVDDDTICTPLQPSETHSELQLATDGDPAEFWCYRNASEADALIPAAAPLNALAAHEQLLGKKVSELTDHQPGKFKPVNQRSEELIRRVEQRDSVVRVTFNGLVGDCAWGSPFGFWHEPMGYLAFAGTSLERLTRAEEFYQQALQSRQLLRVTAGPYLADASFSMLTFCGLDNRELLPPNLPTQRGQDLIFGEILWTCFTDSLFGHLPFALAHDPLPPRRFWPGEITRSASGVDLCRVVIEAMNLLPEQAARENPAERLRTLGSHLMQLAKLPPQILGGKLIAALRASNQQFKHTVMDRGAALMTQAPYYANDLTRYFDKQKKAEGYEHYWIPLDLCAVDGFAAAESRLRCTLEKFGALLEHWPTIVRVARALREQKIRVSVAV